MKIVILASRDKSLVNFRGPLIKALVARGHQVIAAAPPETDSVPGSLRALGAAWEPLDFRRTGVNPFADLGAISRIRALLRRHCPDLFITYTIKPVVYGSFAAGLMGTPSIAAIVTGLGYAFNPRGARGRIIGWIATMFYRVALRFNEKVFFQNPDDMALFVKRKLVDPRKARRIYGSGVDLEHFPASPPPAGRCRFLLIARLLRDKGIGEYAEAARRIKKLRQDVEFHLLGPLDPNPNGIKREEVDAWVREGVLIYHGFQNDVRPFLRACTMYVLPSYYPEGTPRSVLEAMATGRAVVTTDSPGCRETVFLTERGCRQRAGGEGIMEGENGVLVRPRDVRALTEALLLLMNDPRMSRRMARRGRELAEAVYDARKVSAFILEELGC